MIDKRKIQTELFRAVASLQDAHSYLGHVEQILRGAESAPYTYQTKNTLYTLGQIKRVVTATIDNTTKELKHYQPEA